MKKDKEYILACSVVLKDKHCQDCFGRKTSDIKVSLYLGDYGDWWVWQECLACHSNYVREFEECDKEIRDILSAQLALAVRDPKIIAPLLKKQTEGVNG